MGNPCVNVPVLKANGLPIGVQVIARFGNDPRAGDGVVPGAGAGEIRLAQVRAATMRWPDAAGAAL